METQKQQCCVRECDSRNTHEHRGVGTDNLGRPTILHRSTLQAVQGRAPVKQKVTLHLL